MTIWLIDVANCLKPIGRTDALLLVARIRSRKHRSAGSGRKATARWSDVTTRLNMTRGEATHRLDMAIVHFTDNLHAAGVTLDVHRRLAAA